MMCVIALCISGLAVCLYGWWVERNIERNPAYKAACDISDQVSCSKVFRSPYAYLFGFSNVYKGMMFYSLVALLAFLGYEAAVFWLAVAAVFVSVWLAYILVVHIKTTCVICCVIYLINALLLVASAYSYWH